MPLGWRVSATQDTIRAVASTGRLDCILDMPPAGWPELISAAESSGLRYLLSRDAEAPRAPGFVVKPERFRLDGISRRGRIELTLPHAVSVYYVLATEEGSAISKRGWAPIQSGKITIQVDQAYVSEKFSLVLFPKYAYSDYTDFWERFDSSRDDLLKLLQHANLGAGLRGIVNPLGRVTKWTPVSGGFVPDSELFRIEFQNYLETKYRDVSSLNRAWRVRSFDLVDFPRASKLVALFSGNRGIESLWEPASDTLFAVDMKTSAYWADVRAAIDIAAARRTDRLANALQRVANVPVIYEWSGWSPLFDSRIHSGDGVGIRSVGAGSAATEMAAGGASSAIAWRNRGWLVATEISPGNGAVPDARTLAQSVIHCADLGAKAWFVRMLPGSDHATLSGLEAETSANSHLVDRGRRVLFYPENARFPADTMQLPGGIWWLPTPFAGNRIDIGTGYEGYRLVSPFGNSFVLWRSDAPKRVKLRFLDPSRANIMNYDGSQPDIKASKDGLELTVGTMPIIITGTDDLPVPQDALDALNADYRTLSAKARTAGIDVADSRFLFEDSSRRLSSNPGPAYNSMVENLRKIEKAVGPFVWTEAEKPDETNFAFAPSNAGASGGRILAVDTPFMHTEGSFYAAYVVRVKPAANELDLWIAARIPTPLRKLVQIELRGRDPIPLSDLSVASYGDGFSWFNVSRLQLNSGSHRITIRVLPGAADYDLSLDVVLLAPPGFRPSGLKLPPAL